MSRIALLKARLSARTKPDGKPLPGYAKNVLALKDEIARLDRLAADAKNPGGENL
jgi:hypothetical protein